MYSINIYREDDATYVLQARNVAGTPPREGEQIQLSGKKRSYRTEILEVDRQIHAHKGQLRTYTSVTVHLAKEAFDDVQDTGYWVFTEL